MKLLRGKVGVRMFKKLLYVAVAAGLTGCSESTPTVEKKEVARPTKAFVAMNDPTVDTYIVRDISDSLQGGVWRWTFDNPEMRLMVAKPDNVKLEADFSIADATFKTTGVVTVKFFVDDKQVGTLRCPKSGAYHFSAAVPAGLLKENTLANVRAEVRPLWTSPGDGKHLGMILVKAGFVS